MRKSLLGLCILLISINVMANENAANALGEFAWEKRQLIVFSPHIENDQYGRFQKYLIDFEKEFDDRNLQTWYVIGVNSVLLGTNIRNDVSNQDFRKSFSVKNNQFRLLLIGYDQGEKFRQQRLNLELIFAEIDQMPLRIQEIKTK